MSTEHPWYMVSMNANPPFTHHTVLVAVHRAYGVAFFVAGFDGAARDACGRIGILGAPREVRLSAGVQADAMLSARAANTTAQAQRCLDQLIPSWCRLLYRHLGNALSETQTHALVRRSVAAATDFLAHRHGA